jgi:MtrB/PioB family decaheme-associated outer membrane protein
MSNKNELFRGRALVVAVRGALLAMAVTPMYCGTVLAQSAEELTQTKSQVEVGVANTSQNSFKFGEYNGLQKQGGSLIGNIDLKSRNTDDDSTTRWRIKGTDLGLETRKLDIEFSDQGKYKLNFGYDELLRNRSDSYQTPLTGAGSNALTLPPNWRAPILPQVSGTAINSRVLSPTVGTSNSLVGGVSTAPSAAQLATGAAIRAADLPAFQNVNLYTKRTRYDGGIDFKLNSNWSLEGSVRFEHKDGLKPTSSVSRQNGGATQNGDNALVLPELINQDHTQVNAGINWRDGKNFVQGAYYGSFFKNNVASMSWNDYGITGPSAASVNTMAEAPSNQLHQFSLNGGYALSDTTRLTAGGSYGRNTQNDQYLVIPASMPILPANSASGLVVNKSFNLKAVSRPFKDLNLSGGYKFDERDNRTPVKTYGYFDAQETPGAALGNAAFANALGVNPATFRSITNVNANRPYSKKTNQFNIEGDYAVAKGQNVKLGYDWQKIDRWCNGSWVDCADAATTRESTLKAEWRGTISEDLSARVGYNYSQRKVSNYNENAFLALVPMAGVVPVGATQSAQQFMQANGLTGFGPNLGFGPTAGNAAFFFPGNNTLPSVAAYSNVNRISELIGMRRFNMADRNRDKVRSSVNWDATDKLSFQGGFDVNNDAYDNSVYGLKEAKSWTLNLDATYAATEDLSGTVFYSHEDQKSKSAGNNIGVNNDGLGANSNVSGLTAISGNSACAPGLSTIALRNQSNKIDPCNNWSTDMRDKTDTLGLSVKKKNLMSGKLDLTGTFLFTRARTDTNVFGGSYANNPLAAVAGQTIAAFYIPAAPLPTVSTNITDLRLNGKYVIDKQQSVRLGYSYSRMKAVDYAYDGLQTGAMANPLPTNETAPVYKVHVIGASYIYSF